VLTYAAVTPARDEEENLGRLAEAMLAQSILPVRWVIVENGSTDGTAALAAGLAASHAWVRLVQTEPTANYDRTSPYMRAWHAGVESTEGLGDVVVKLDADVSFEPGFFERILAEFEADPTLGITSGSCHEWRDGEWRAWELPGDAVWGPTRSYRRSCLEIVLPLHDTVAYSIIDVAKAQLAGYRVRHLRDLPFRHHRPEGTGEGSRWRAWFGEGEAARYVWYRPTYVLGRCIYRLRRDRAAAGLVAGYLSAALRRKPRYADPEVRRAVRDRQRARRALAVATRRLATGARTSP
jgi:glycosyltransferase involved in cell wall biosynthesis